MGTRTSYLLKFAKPELLVFIVLILVSVFLRFTQLGYSHFYGDEVKVLYLRKDVAASDFLLNQRKGPMQFVVAWMMEKLIGGYDEFWTRVPYAAAAVLAVVAFYFLAKKMFEWRVAAAAGFLFSLNGFFIAFGRTVQYQSFLLLFGFLALLMCFMYFEAPDEKNEKNEEESQGFVKFLKKLKLSSPQFYLILTGIFFGFAYLSHWDAVFFDASASFILISVLTSSKSQLVKRLKEMVIFLVLPFAIVVLPFMFPYFYNGHFSSELAGYLNRRLTGAQQLPSSSVFTYTVYNPTIISVVVLFYAVFAFFPKNLNFVDFWQNLKKRPKLSNLLKIDWNLQFLLFWFLISFLAFEVIISNPGTHIQNYIIPLIILAGAGFVRLIDLLSPRFYQTIHMAVFVIALFLLFRIATWVYIPYFNSGYPWNDPLISQKSHQLFLYGFPYYRGWDQIADFVNKTSGIRSYYTNDNVTIPERYYLQGVSVHEPAPAQMPQYYFYVKQSQEFKEPIDDGVDLVNDYSIVGTFNEGAIEAYKIK